MSIVLNSSAITNGILTVDATVTPPVGYKIKSFFITCGSEYAYYLIPRRYYYATLNDYNEPIQDITTPARSLSRIPLAQWPNGALNFVVSAKYQNTSTAAIITEATPVTISITNTAYQAPQAPDPILQPEGQLQQPVITVFDVPTTVASKTIPLILTAKDNNAVAGYFVSESLTTPAANDPLWQASPTSYTVSGYSAYTLYAWAKDADGNISDRVSATKTTTPPPPPSALPTGGRYQTAQTVTLTDPAGGTIAYTTDGSNPLHYIPVNGGKATFDGNGVLILTEQPYTP